MAWTTTEDRVSPAAWPCLALTRTELNPQHVQGNRHGARAQRTWPCQRSEIRGKERRDDKLEVDEHPSSAVLGGAGHAPTCMHLGVCGERMLEQHVPICHPLPLSPRHLGGRLDSRRPAAPCICSFQGERESKQNTQVGQKRMKGFGFLETKGGYTQIGGWKSRPESF